MRHFLVILFLVLTASGSKSQEALQLASKTINTIKSCKTISHYSFQKWGKIGDETEIDFNEGECIFKIEDSDTIIGSYYCLKPDSYSLLYNGKATTSVNWKDSTLTYTDLGKYPGEKRSVSSKMLYTHSVIHVYNLLKEAKKGSPDRIQLLKDSTINGITCRRLIVVYSDTVVENQRRYFHRIISIDAKSYLPLHSKSVYEGEFGKQIIEATLTNYKIDDPIVTKEMFSHSSIDACIKRVEFEPQKIQQKEALSENQPAPEWSLPVIGADTLRLADLRGKVVLLEFSGVNCGFCLLAIPQLNKLNASFAPSKFTLVSLYSDSQVDKLIRYKQKYNMNFSILYNGKIEQEKQKIKEKYRVGGIPHFFLIDQKGRIARNWVGYHPKIGEVISEEIKKLLE